MIVQLLIKNNYIYLFVFSIWSFVANAGNTIDMGEVYDALIIKDSDVVDCLKLKEVKKLKAIYELSMTYDLTDMNILTYFDQYEGSSLLINGVDNNKQVVNLFNEAFHVVQQSMLSLTSKKEYQSYEVPLLVNGVINSNLEDMEGFLHDVLHTAQQSTLFLNGMKAFTCFNSLDEVSGGNDSLNKLRESTYHEVFHIVQQSMLLIRSGNAGIK